MRKPSKNTLGELLVDSLTELRDGLRGRSKKLTMPIPPLQHGQTRAQRAPHNPPGSKRANKPAPRPRHGPGGGWRPRGR